MNIKLILKIVVLIVVAIIAFHYRSQIIGILLGGAGAVVYFSLTGSTLNWIYKKK